MSNKGAVSANDLPRAPEPPVAHPLALELARIVAARATPVRVLVLGVGSGRNLPALLASGARVDAVEDEPARLNEVAARFRDARVRAATYAGPYPFASGYAGVLSTHALLHGSRATIASAVAAVRSALLPGGHFLTTLGSTLDPRYGTGSRIEDGTFAPNDGSEAGVAHVYFDEGSARALLRGYEVEGIELVGAAQTVGRWAHTASEAKDLVHWFVRARKIASRSADLTREHADLQ